MQKILDADLPYPFLFNRMKHHLGYIKKFVEQLVSVKDESTLFEKLLTIGESQMDLYLGRLSSIEICRLIEKELISNKRIGKREFEEWLSEGKAGYKIIILPDKSFWALRSGKSERYIHIHPGRYSPNTIRAKASTLKTGIAVTFFSEVLKEKAQNLNFINTIRKEFLGLSPVKSISKNKGIEKIILLLNNIK